MRSIWGAAGLAALALAVSACGSSGSSSGSSSSGANSTPAAAGGSTVSQTTVGGQQVLTNAKGDVLYWFVPDTPTESKCSGSCLTFWPVVPGPVTAGSGVTGTLGTITRSDGSKQATYDGHPLYTTTADKLPGQAKGNGVWDNGGQWHEVVMSDGPAPSDSDRDGR